MESSGRAEPYPAADPVGGGTSPAPVDKRSFRDGVGRFATGITVVGVRSGDQTHAMTANSFTSVSLDPPLILICVSHNAVLHDLILGSGRWTVSVLGADQEHAARLFARRGEAAEHLRTIPNHPGAYTDAPLIDGSLAYLECVTTATYPGGDHTIVIGEVVWVDVPRPRDPALGFHRGEYVELA